MNVHAHLLIAASLQEARMPEVYKTQSTDCLHFVTDTFTIEQARALRQATTSRPVVDERRVLVVFVQQLTIEAQNALLKVFEEPPHDVVLYLIVPDESVLLATLRSRLIQTKRTEKTKAPAVPYFLALSVADRIAQIAAKVKTKDTAWIHNTAFDVATYIESRVEEFSTSEIKAALFVLKAIKIRGGSKKMLLEHLALSLKCRS